MVGIYKITNPKGRIYIGQSVNILKRIYFYKTLSCKGQPKLYNSLKKYGWEKHKFEIIKECTLEQLNIEEIKYKIKTLRKFNEDWNKVLFCEVYDNGGGPLSQETKEKISKSKKGHKCYEGNKWKHNISKSNKGKKFSKEHKLNLSKSLKNKLVKKETREKMSKILTGREILWKDKISKALKGTKRSKLTRKKISESKKGNQYLKGIKYSQESKDKISISKSKPIICLNTGIKYRNVREASQDLKISPTLIHSVLKNQRKTAKNHSFAYVN